MVDTVTPDQRSRIMAQVKGKNTEPELLVRSLVHRLGFRFRLHRKDLPGKPDIVLPRHRKVIFVHGCFWHGHADCKRSARPTSRTEYWNAKIDRNMARDAAATAQLAALGWTALMLWECELRAAEALSDRLHGFLDTPNETEEERV